MRIGDENLMADPKQYWDIHALILTKMRIGDENMMIRKEMKMGCLILSKIAYRHALILTKMRIGDENRIPDLKQDEYRGLMGCLISKQV